MPSISRRSAALLTWRSPLDEACSLTPVKDRDGLLEVEFQEGGVVIIHARNCRVCTACNENHQDQKFAAEVEMTLPLAVCQITWSFVEGDEAGEGETQRLLQEIGGLAGLLHGPELTMHIWSNR